MKAVFLDIDGVLNCHRTCIAFGGIPHTTANGGVQLLDPVAIGLIGGIVRLAGAVVVLSSTWRKHEDWTQYGKDLCLPIVDRTPSLPGIRGVEIKHWLDRHPGVEQFAIIDDDRDMLPEQLPYFVHTSGFDGFSWANALRLADLLDVNIFDVNHPGQRLPEVTKGLDWEGV